MYCEQHKDKLSEAEQSKIDWDWEAIYEWEKEWLKMLVKQSTSWILGVEISVRRLNTNSFINSLALKGLLSQCWL